ncbi:ABC transporter substrate-binding protein [Actinomadura sp. NBRC 104412]|uniref:ABC transporter substrate-binding protein n=1 Tax=Actinomadura sp. NBRC 104412 TaxID=3032203 RepID=UPI0024A20356|nr:ABC transporter substrate-binding protein [Actinomadura sp. NBRC 104412]GLZ02612.1 ABC transporter substrate-binding protein [Actinomadura sp. NBRC 104412]
MLIRRSLRSGWVTLACLAMLAFTAACGGAGGSGGSDGPIKIGGICPLSGPVAVAGQRCTAVKAYFDHLNDQGGINGRDVEYVLRDDAYNPSTTLQVSRQLVERDRVLATVDSIGTATQLAVRDYFNQKKIPQLFVASAATPFSAQYKEYPYTMAWDVPAVISGALYAKDIAANFRGKTVAVIYQDDDAGKSYLSGFENEARKVGVTIVAKQGYDPTATSVTGQISALKQSNADILVSFAVPGFTPKILAAVYSQGWSPVKYIDPGSGSNAAVLKSVAQQAGSPAAVEGVRSGTFYKDPNDPALASDEGIKLYKQIMAKYCKGCDVTSQYYLQGMATAWSFAELLKSIEGDITSESILKASRSLNQANDPFLLDGMVISTSADDREPLNQQGMAEFKNGRYVLIGDLVSSS